MAFFFFICLWQLCQHIILWQANLIAPSAGSIEIKDMAVICSPVQTSWVEDMAKIPSCTLQILPN